MRAMTHQVIDIAIVYLNPGRQLIVQGRPMLSSKRNNIGVPVLQPLEAQKALRGGCALHYRRTTDMSIWLVIYGSQRSAVVFSNCKRNCSVMSYGKREVSIDPARKLIL